VIKLGIVLFNEPEYCPYMYTYLHAIKNLDVKTTVLSWKRCEGGNNVVKDCEIIEYKAKLDYNTPKYLKVLAFIRWSIWINSVLGKENFDCLIVMTTIPAILMAPILVHRYQKKFVLDIRDFTIEKSMALRAIERYLISKAYLTVISSDGFRSFLPKHNYIIDHNVNKEKLENSGITITSFDLLKKPPYRMIYVGTISYLKENIYLLKKLGNDKRFIIEYWGFGPAEGELRKYVGLRNLKNVYFMGKYPSYEKDKIITRADIIINYYGNSEEVKYALSNKLYDAALNGKPVLCSNGTYLAEITTKSNIGIIIDKKGTGQLGDRIAKAFTDLSREVLETGCNAFLQQIRKDYEVFRNEIRRFIHNNISSV
jgi:glycosyltransferase involved in cell wall biosynthesis